MLVQTFTVRGVEVGLFQVGGEERAVEAAGVAQAAFEHGAGVAARRQADQNALLGAPGGGNAMRVQVVLQVPVYHVGGEEEGQFAEFGEHTGVAHGDIGRGIDDFDFVGFVKEFFGDAGGGALSGEALDGSLLFADVLYVDRGDYGDALFQDLLDILPAFRIAAAGRIVEGQLVDQADLGMAAEDRGQVDGAIDGRNDFQTGDNFADRGGDFTLRGGDYDILSAFLAAASLIEHAKRFADARRVPQEDLEAAAPFTPLLRLYAAEEFVGIEPAVSSAGHYA